MRLRLPLAYSVSPFAPFRGRTSAVSRCWNDRWISCSTRREPAPLGWTPEGIFGCAWHAGPRAKRVHHSDRIRATTVWLIRSRCCAKNPDAQIPLSTARLCSAKHQPLRKRGGVSCGKPPSQSSYPRAARRSGSPFLPRLPLPPPLGTQHASCLNGTPSSSLGWSPAQPAWARCARPATRQRSAGIREVAHLSRATEASATYVLRTSTCLVPC